MLNAGYLSRLPMGVFRELSGLADRILAWRLPPAHPNGQGAYVNPIEDPCNMGPAIIGIGRWDY